MTEVVSSASTERVPPFAPALRLNVCEKITSVPFGTTVYPASDGLPVMAYDTRFESRPRSIPIRIGIVCRVGFAELLVVLSAELATIVSAFAVSMKLLARTSKASFLIIFSPLR